MTQNIFVVLGVARSGTSAVVRALKAVGVDLGANFVDVDTKWNAKGFWEDSDIVYKINGRVFRALDFAPYGIETLAPEKQTSAAVQPIKLSALALLKEHFATTQNWGFKDPSTVKLLAFWQAIFAEANINEHYVICLRNPLASATSYQKLTECDLEVGLLLWLMHMLPAIAGTQHKKRIVISYETLLKNPRLQLQRLQDVFHLKANEADIDQYVNEFLDKKLLHNQFSQADLLKDPAVKMVPLCIKAYDLFLQLAHDELSFEDAAFYKQWEEIETELLAIYPVYAYMDVLLKRNYQLTRTLRMMQKTFIWKFYAPIKAIYDRLRGQRRAARSAKRIAKAYG